MTFGKTPADTKFVQSVRAEGQVKRWYKQSFSAQPNLQLRSAIALNYCPKIGIEARLYLGSDLSLDRNSGAWRGEWDRAWRPE
ncbi:hypothetical protein GCM10009712_10630 [Pseudarthrobacter sulfonivorans]